MAAEREPTSVDISGTLRRLYILDYGLFRVHENGRVIGIPGYLLETQDGEHILVDTGFPPKYADDPEEASIEDDLGTFGEVVALGQRNLPEGQLGLLGLAPADIHTLVLTHSDIDHVGAIDRFPGATIVLGAAERTLPRPRYFGDRTPLEWPPDADYRRIEGDTPLCPGALLLATPGHSPGHLSLLVRLEETGHMLLTGDAISRPDELVEGFGGAWDPAQARTSATRLLEIANRQRAFVVYGHDPQQWPALRKAPTFYA